MTGGLKQAFFCKTFWWCCVW